MPNPNLFPSSPTGVICKTCHGTQTLSRPEPPSPSVRNHRSRSYVSTRGSEIGYPGCKAETANDGEIKERTVGLTRRPLQELSEWLISEKE